MNYRSLGQTGMMVSPIAIGTFNFGGPTSEADSNRIIARALEAGINFFDVANSYNEGRSEEFLGRALKEHAVRDDVIIATKAHYSVGKGPNDSGNSRLHIIRECERSLKRMGVDYIDLFQIHRPDFVLPVEETLGALTDLVRQGKVRYIGCSTHPAWKVMEALAVSEARGYARYVAEQPPYNLLDRRVENELVPLCLKHGLGIIPYAPLAQGVLAGRYASKNSPPPDSRAVLRGGAYADRVNTRGIEIGRRLTELAAEAGITTAQLAMLWIKDRPGVTAPLFGPRTVEQLEDVLPVLEMSFPEELEDKCDALVPPGSAVTNFHNGCHWMKQVLMF
ncbi:MAG: aldo/keto reductase [Betaproteobacteria bacterium]|nr:aldo/keto reductase [Betaproteobacteria bacterium]